MILREFQVFSEYWSIDFERHWNTLVLFPFSRNFHEKTYKGKAIIAHQHKEEKIPRGFGTRTCLFRIKRSMLESKLNRKFCFQELKNLPASKSLELPMMYHVHDLVGGGFVHW